MKLTAAMVVVRQWWLCGDGISCQWEWRLMTAVAMASLPLPLVKTQQQHDGGSGDGGDGSGGGDDSRCHCNHRCCRLRLGCLFLFDRNLFLVLKNS